MDHPILSRAYWQEEIPLSVELCGELGMANKSIYGIIPGSHEGTNENWDEELVRAIFFPIDANRILNIPLPHTEMEDVLCWRFEKNGIYSVRSPYHEE